MLILARLGSLDRWHVLKMISNNYYPKPLSARQRECLRLIAEGHTAQSAALWLGISVRMVHFHLRAAREKLNAASTGQAIHIAVKMGLMD